MDSDEMCPRCKTTKFNNPSLKMMVNVCGHALCNNCVVLLFAKGSGLCFTCEIYLKRKNFQPKIFEDGTIDKEVKIRKMILKIFNKTESDFKTPRQYNDYLEEVESIIYNLCNDIDVEKTNSIIEKYKFENKDNIAKNNALHSKEKIVVEQKLEEEKHRDKCKKQQLALLEEEGKKQLSIDKEAMIDQLSFSSIDASHIIQHFANKANEYNETIKQKQLKNSIFFSKNTTFNENSVDFSDLASIDESQKYVYSDIEIIVEGPRYPTYEELETKGYTRYIAKEIIRDRAAGYSTKISHMKALQESCFGLYTVFKRK